MIDSRILELLKAPENFSENDLPILETTIRKYPYVQNIKALHLYGVHRFRPENYPLLLSKTAAYTTDKKILYQFINKNKIEENKLSDPIKNVDKDPETEKIEEKKLTKFDVENTIESPAFEPLKPVYVNGELNRILFEGEENFLESHSEKIDLEATLESGILVTSKQESTDNNSFTETSEAENFSKEKIVHEEKIDAQKSEIEDENQVSFHEIPEISTSENRDDSEIRKTEDFQETADAENFTKEKIIDENQISTDENLVENSSELSFHGTDDFMPEIQVKPKTSVETYQVPKTAPNRHEEEMKKLLAEVEAKMKANKKPNTRTEEEIPQNYDINFAETHHDPEPETVKPQPEIVEEKPQSEIPETQKSEENSTWKPMDFNNNLPDSVLDKKEEKIIKKEEIITNPDEKTVINEKNQSVSKTEIPEKTTPEIPVLSVSFLSDSDSIKPKSTETEKPEVPTSESNIPQFINTWQNWLKIDRSAKPENEETMQKPEKIKSQAIDKFIESEPRISPLKEESAFVVKEKSSDISHLMTETLANLYAEQKLYSKAIKAYETLKEKHPEKANFFDEKIEEIKELKNGGSK